ncbi:MAG TPA: AAA family ATPase, partial [Acidimicrobiales bacterium]|nr:AAA family ATPase [Acidimicrobiales bacterium]
MVLAGPLVERTAELEVLDEAVGAAGDGRGGVVVIEGPAGIGKTSLLEEARRLATAGAMGVLAGQGAVLERDFGFGAVRQLFEPMLAARTGPHRHRLLAGAAGLASPVVSPKDPLSGAEVPSQQATAVHGLYWLTANLAEESPLLIVVDDVQWCDAPSIRFLAYLARRIEGLPVLVLTALRTGDPPVDAAAIAEVGAGPAVKVIRPAPLSIDGVTQFVRHGMGEDAEAGFVQACREATGGNPFLVGELMRVLRADGVRPTEAAAAEIVRTGPPTVAHATTLRLSRLAPAASGVAHAVAVLGRHARIDRIASLAGLDAESTRAALDTLVAMEVLTAGPPVSFVHALVHQAIYDDLLESARADAHGRAARMMAAEAAPADEVAAHLLLSSPMGDPDVVEALRTAAGRALARGATQGAVAYLRRALSEGVAEIDRAMVLRELGAAEAFARDPRAAEDLEEAMALTADPLQRTRIALQLSEVYLLSGQWDLRRARLRAARAELGDRDPDLLARVEAARAATDFYDPDLAEEFEARLPSLREVVDQGHPASRLLAVVLGAVGACRCMDRAQVLALVEGGLDGGRLLRDEGPESLALPQAVSALLAFEQLDAAEEATKGVFGEALRRGSVMGYVAGSYYRVAIDTQRGALKDADAHLHTMVELSLEHGLTFALPSAFYFGLDALLERPQLDDVAALVESIELDP